MSRTRYLISYDISNDKRRARVFKLLQGNGDHLQYSVFLCDLNGVELVRLKGELEEIVHHGEDQVILVNMGPAQNDLAMKLECVGRAYCPPSRVLII